MKTLSKNGVIERVGDDVAEIRVRNQGWKYVPKKEAKKSSPTEEVILIKESEPIRKKPYQKPKKS